MERTVKCGWYRRVEVVRDLEGERLVKKWVCLVDGREEVVEGEWGRPPVREGVAWW